MKKGTPKQVRKRTYIILGVGLLIGLIGLALNELVALIMIGLVVMFSAVIHHVIFYRCPHCGKFLDRSTGEYCPYCSRKVNEPE